MTKSVIRRRYSRFQRDILSVSPGTGLSVRVLPDSVDSNKELNIALKNFKNKVKDSQILLHTKDRMRYEKPSSKRRKQRMDAIRTRKKHENFQ